jgi:hypothetical protein
MLEENKQEKYWQRGKDHVQERPIDTPPPTAPNFACVGIHSRIFFL